MCVVGLLIGAIHGEILCRDRSYRSDGLESFKLMNVLKHFECQALFQVVHYLACNWLNKALYDLNYSTLCLSYKLMNIVCLLGIC